MKRRQRFVCSTATKPQGLRLFTLVEAAFGSRHGHVWPSERAHAAVVSPSIPPWVRSTMRRRA